MISDIFTNAHFYRCIDVLSYFTTNSLPNYNVLIIEYLISYFYSKIGQPGVNQWYDNIIDNIVKYKSPDSPMLIIINDADSINTGRDTFQNLVDKLQYKGYNCNYIKMRFNTNTYYSDSNRYQTQQNYFNVDWDFQQKYCVAEVCTSAQMIIEVR